MNIFLAFMLILSSTISCGGNSGNDETRNRGKNPVSVGDPVKENSVPATERSLSPKPVLNPEETKPALAKSPIDLTGLEENLEEIDHRYDLFSLTKDEDKNEYSFSQNQLFPNIILKLEEPNKQIYKYRDGELSIEFDMENRVMEIIFNKNKYILEIYKKDGDNLYSVGFDYTIKSQDITKFYNKEVTDKKEIIDSINNEVCKHISNPYFQSFTNNRTIHLFVSPFTKRNVRESRAKNNGELSGDTRFVNIKLTKNYENVSNVTFNKVLKYDINVKVIKNSSKDKDGKYKYFVDEEIGKGKGTAEVSEAEGHEADIIQSHKTDKPIYFYFYVMKRKIIKEEL